MMASRFGQQGWRSGSLAAVAITALLTTFVLAVVLPNLWYGLHDVSDIPLYQSYASRMAKGEIPFTGSFLVEYPPLAMPLFRLPGHVGDAADYAAWFGAWMSLLTILASVLTVLVARLLWADEWRTWAVVLLFPLGVALTGAIILNRYDAAVAWVLAGVLLCLVRRWYTAAALIVGIGFALKFTPAALLPLVLLLTGPPRLWWRPILAFTLAAVVPFIVYLPPDLSGIWHVFRYHMERPLQIESVLATPMLLGQLLGADWAHSGHSHGSQSLIAPGTDIAAAASGLLTLLAAAGVYSLIWRRRARLATTAGDAVLAVFALLLALMSFSKVLSPQYFIWLLPAWALVAVRDRTLAILGCLVLLLTHVEFPALYWRLVAMDPLALAIVIARNLLLLALFATTAWRLWRLPDSASDAGRRDRTGTARRHVTPGPAAGPSIPSPP